jgi:hypothetical protein
MKTLRHYASQPASIPLVADDVLEFHAGRIVLLLATCGGVSSAINGLTKMAKLDFFVRYPDFFEVVSPDPDRPNQGRAQAVEAAMIRHRYGPWDKRYYHVLAFLESRGLVTIKKAGKSFRIGLTRAGKSAAKRIAAAPAFAGMTEQMKRVADSLGSKTGNELKRMIYSVFDEEVGQRSLGQVITRE